MAGSGGGFHRSTQHFILKGKDGVTADETKQWSRVQLAGDSRAVGQVPARATSQHAAAMTLTILNTV